MPLFTIHRAARKIVDRHSIELLATIESASQADAEAYAATVFYCRAGQRLVVSPCPNHDIWMVRRGRQLWEAHRLNVDAFVAWMLRAN